MGLEMFKLIALAAIVGCAALASQPSDDEVRQKFLAEHAQKPGFKYLKKKALDAQKKQTVQRKKTSGPQELEAKAINQSGPESLQEINKSLANFLYQGDMLLTQAQAVYENFTDAGKQRRAGPLAKFDDGSTRPKWPHDSPICYKFQPGSDPWTKELMRKGAQYWTENTCLTWKEG
ncbi:hypothetical protein AAVH_24929 [Aphelenchoides avenae]|nr:hypothetical protein AAVH_24929 [Aphelenchus avenae]